MKYENLFAGTSMNSDVLGFYGSHANTLIRHHYTPHRLYIWNRGSNSQVDVERLALHELCHITDFYINDKSRLLKPDFGFPAVLNSEWSKMMVVNETRVIAMQKSIISYMRAVEKYEINMATIDTFFDVIGAENHMTMEEYFDLMWSFEKDFRGSELVYTFQCAMQYIKSNRQ